VEGVIAMPFHETVCAPQISVKAIVAAVIGSILEHKLATCTGDLIEGVAWPFQTKHLLDIGVNKRYPK